LLKTDAPPEWSFRSTEEPGQGDAEDWRVLGNIAWLMGHLTGSWHLMQFARAWGCYLQSFLYSKDRTQIQIAMHWTYWPGAIRLL
jgi:hypothetical protein